MKIAIKSMNGDRREQQTIIESTVAMIKVDETVLFFGKIDKILYLLILHHTYITIPSLYQNTVDRMSFQNIALLHATAATAVSKTESQKPYFANVRQNRLNIIHSCFVTHQIVPRANTLLPLRFDTFGSYFEPVPTCLPVK